MLHDKSPNDAKKPEEDYSEAEQEDEEDESHTQFDSDSGQTELLEHQSTQNIDSTQALFIPVAASVSLLLMFFFFDSIQTAFVICTSGKQYAYLGHYPCTKQNCRLFKGMYAILD